MLNNYPIGIFDSGIGGLSVARQIRRLLPNENIIYIADSKHAPYGDKSVAYINQRVISIVQYLLEQNCKAIVIACNTATMTSIDLLRSIYDIPIIGIEPGVKPAALNSKSGVIGVLATSQTLSSVSFNTLANMFSSNVKIEVQACSGLVEQVESLKLESKKTIKLVSKYVQPLIREGADNIVLGCTHYFFLIPIIRRIVGEDIEIINTDTAIASQTIRVLNLNNICADKNMHGNDIFLSSGNMQDSQKQFRFLWNKNVEVKMFTQ